MTLPTEAGIHLLVEEEVNKVHTDLLAVTTGFPGTIVEGGAGPVCLSAMYHEPQTLETLAAFYLSRLSKDHIFADVNKRTAYFASRFFLMTNGADFNGTDAETAASEMQRIAMAPNVDRAYEIALGLCSRDIVYGQATLDYPKFYRLVVKSIGVANLLSDR